MIQNPWTLQFWLAWKFHPLYSFAQLRLRLHPHRKTLTMHWNVYSEKIQAFLQNSTQTLDRLSSVEWVNYIWKLCRIEFSQSTELMHIWDHSKLPTRKLSKKSKIVLFDKFNISEQINQVSYTL